MTIPAQTGPPDDAPAPAPGVAEAATLITPAARARLASVVERHGGVEVFSIGVVDAEGLVAEIDSIAFGNDDSVPAPAQNARSGQVLIHNHPGGDLTPSDADISLAALYGKAGVGFYIVDNACTRVRVVVRPFSERMLKPVDLEALSDLFSPDGRLASSLAGYEYRPQQIAMMRLVADAFNRQHVAFVEAGTGVGKSFAYLAPALLWATANGRRVVVSTNTINLQEQLMAKDIPDLRSRLGVEFKAVLLKGRGNYVSLRRLKVASTDAGMFENNRDAELLRLREWAGRSHDGSRSDLAFEVSDDVWEAVQSDKDDCLRAHCPHFNDCFFYRSRREAASADVVVANHHLVLADLAIKKDSTGSDFVAILPPYEHIIFDEGHNLEEAATSYFGAETSPLAIRRHLARLSGGRDRRGPVHGLVQALLAVDGGMRQPQTARILDLLEDRVPSSRQELEQALEHHFDTLFQTSLEYFNVGSLGPRERRELRITPNVTASPYWEGVTQALEDLTSAMEDLLKVLAQVLDAMRGYREEDAARLADARLALQSPANKLAEHMGALRFFLKAGDEDYCRWLELGFVRERPAPRLCVAPLDVGPSMRTALFERKKTVVLTSATLTVDHGFDFIARQLGLRHVPADSPQPGAVPPEATLPDLADVEARARFLALDSPFDYERNCLLGVPTDLAAPNDPAFEASAQEAILGALRLTQGRAFVLFTSYAMLERVHRNLAGLLARDGIQALRQGSMPRSRLLDAFRSTPHSVLFATSSFWEGVDVQGRALECLIITKLPFRVPTTPILEARTERIDRLGGDSFRDLAIPLAVIRFKQGFGRLIRSKSDRGIVMVLDHRVVTKGYGRSFLRSLPPARVVADSADTVLGAFREFMDRG